MTNSFHLIALVLLLAQPAPEAPGSVEKLEPEPVPLLFELPWSVRRDLPDIELTIWRFDPDPALRWAKINGQRVVEGETTEGGVQIEQILEDGVICVVDEQRFRIR